VCSSETSARMNQATRRYVSEDSSLNLHSCENLKSHKRGLHQEDAYVSATNGLPCLKTPSLSADNSFSKRLSLFLNMKAALRAVS